MTTCDSPLSAATSPRPKLPSRLACLALVTTAAPSIAAPALVQTVEQAERQTHHHITVAEPEEPAVELSAVYTADVWRNARGGLKRGWRYLDNLDVTLAVDADRLIGWKDASFFAYGLYNNGRSLSGDLVGDLQTASNIDTGQRAVRLYEAWIEQRFAAGRASVKLGLYDLNSEFDTNGSSALFLHSAHGIGTDFSQSGRNGPSIFPVTSLALRADYKLSDRWLIRAAVLDGVPGDPDRPARTAIKLRDGDGALLVSELQFEDARTRAGLGAWGYTARFEDILASQIAGVPVETARSRGLYAFAERRLSGGDGPAGVSAWLRAGVADSRANPVARYVGGGLVHSGSSDPDKERKLGIAVAIADLGDPYRRALLLSGAASDRREVNVELTYRASLTPWLTVQPDVQYILNPGADPALRDAVLFGLRIEVGQ